MAKDKRTHVECKCCKKRLWTNRILQHLNHATKSDCKSNYSEDELNKLKEASQKRSANLRKKWKKKNKTYYASQRAGYYQVNKYTLSKKSSEYYSKNKDKISKRQSEYYQKKKEVEEEELSFRKEELEEELSQRKEELEEQLELRKIKADMPKYKDWQVERVKYYMDIAKWGFTKDWERWKKNIENFSKKGVQIDDDIRIKSLPKLEDFHSVIQEDLDLLIDEVVNDDSIIDYDYVEEKFQKLIKKLEKERRLFEEKIAVIMREIGNEIGIKVYCGRHGYLDSYNKSNCWLCKDGFFRRKIKDSSQDLPQKNKEYIRKRRPVNITMEDLEPDSSGDEEFKPKETWGCADGPAMDDRNLCRPYNFRQKPKYANDPFNSKTVTKLTRYSE